MNWTLTSVKGERARYTAEVSVSDGITAKVTPPMLEFSGLKDKRNFTVKLSWELGCWQDEARRRELEVGLQDACCEEPYCDL